METRLTRRKMILGTSSTLLAAASQASLGNALPRTSTESSASFLEILRQPDSLIAFEDLKQPIALERSGDAWSKKDIHVQAENSSEGQSLHLSAPVSKLTYLRLRWQIKIPAQLSILGDHWERSYGDLFWGPIIPERVLPWYFLTHDKIAVHSYGVKTGAAAMCFWQVDPEGVNLWLNIANGGSGLSLGNRRLPMATIVTRRGRASERPMESARAFCSLMCDRPRTPSSALYGSNDWYYAYGQNSAEQTLRDADLIASCAPSTGARPFAVIDDGWKRREAFPDMPQLAAQIRSRKVRPGIWVRPLQAPADTNPNYLLPSARYGNHKERYNEAAYDPTTAEGLEAAIAKVRQVVDWGYELVKHDFSTYELLGRWGSEMGAELTSPGWHFQDRSKTTAEIILDLYRALRKEAGEKTLVIGCNTVGHLGAGTFECQRTGDDVSGREWERTRRMGVNTLAYRLVQNRTFFLQDADCVPITRDIPWENTRLWLDLVARSGGALLISPSPEAIGPEQKHAITEAFALATAVKEAEPRDWVSNTTPSDWRFLGKEEKSQKYDWYGRSGAWPFPV